MSHSTALCVGLSGLSLAKREPGSHFSFWRIVHRPNSAQMFFLLGKFLCARGTAYVQPSVAACLAPGDTDRRAFGPTVSRLIMLRTVVASEVNARGLELRDARTFDERVIIHDPAVA
eukprot:COSAG06_NODE_16472_length_999_cov_1.143333_2_plen_117_part_00